MISKVTIGVPKLGAKLFLWGILLLGLLVGCREGLKQDVEAGVDTPVGATVAPVSPAVAEVPQTAVPTDTTNGGVSVAEVPSPESSPTVTATIVVPAAPEPTTTPYVCPYLTGRTEIGMLASNAMAEQPRFLVHLPPCYEQYPNKVFPTLYLFHGWPLDEWHWIDLGISAWADDWVSRGLVGPFLIVLPGVAQNGLYVNSSGGDGSFEGFVVNELVPHIDANYRTVQAPSGRAVGGISRGGVWALEIALRHQDLFSSVGAHSPALAVNNPLPQYDPYRLIHEDISGLRFYLDAGNADWTRAGVIRFRDELIALDADVTYDVHAGNHVDELWRGAVPDYLAFYTALWPGTYQALPEWVDRSLALP